MLETSECSLGFGVRFIPVVTLATPLGVHFSSECTFLGVRFREFRSALCALLQASECTFFGGYCVRMLGKCSEQLRSSSIDGPIQMVRTGTIKLKKVSMFFDFEIVL